MPDEQGFAFVSYAKEDIGVVSALVEALEKRGVLVRFDKNLTA